MWSRIAGSIQSRLSWALRDRGPEFCISTGRPFTGRDMAGVVMGMMLPLGVVVGTAVRLGTVIRRQAQARSHLLQPPPQLREHMAHSFTSRITRGEQFDPHTPAVDVRPHSQRAQVLRRHPQRHDVLAWLGRGQREQGLGELVRKGLVRCLVRGCGLGLRRLELGGLRLRLHLRVMYDGGGHRLRWNSLRFDASLRVMPCARHTAQRTHESGNVPNLAVTPRRPTLHRSNGYTTVHSQP